MSVEFRKLEKQLLGARGGGSSGGAAALSAETAASRERREKLHSFIVHLEDTIQQIKDGCLAELEDAGGADTSTTDASTDKTMTDMDEDRTAATTATTTNTADKDDDDNNKAKRDFANSAALVVAG